VSPVQVEVRSGETLNIYFETPGRIPHPDAAFKAVYLEGEAQVVYEGDLWPDTIY
jgi:hypothetical protein